MKSIKMALLGGAALAVTAAAAHADDLDTLKAQIETLNARVAAMETAPSVPAGYQLIAISEGAQPQTPGLEMKTRELANYGKKATIISVMPTADAPAGTTITWSGYARAGAIYTGKNLDVQAKVRANDFEPWVHVDNDVQNPFNNFGEDSDYDVLARGQLRVKAATDTAVGEVGVDIRIRADFDGIASAGTSFYSDVAWGYWAMTPELTLGGGYAGTLGDIGYGFDGACTCNYIQTLGMNPGDTSQMRLSYGSGPFSMAIALEDASLNTGFDGLNAETNDNLGVAGEVKYSGDMFSGEISGVWRDIGDTDGSSVADEFADQFLPSSWWQVGAGLGFGLGDMASLSFAASMGEGPVANFSDSGINDVQQNDLLVPWNNQYWAVSGVLSVNINDAVHAELGGGYRNRDFDNIETLTTDYTASGDYWVVGGGLYYNPVDQLTIGLEASYSETTFNANKDVKDPFNGPDVELDVTQDTLIVDLVSVWRF